MYTIFATKHFERKKIKLSKDLLKKRAIDKCINRLKNNPFHNSLRTHKADIKYGLKVFSSWVWGDIRIAWIFNNEEIEVIDLIDIGDHNYYK